MKRPQYVFRPNLNEPQHRRAWALLQQVPPAKRKEFLVQSILAAEQTDRLEKSIRKVVREELQAVNICLSRCIVSFRDTKTTTGTTTKLFIRPDNLRVLVLGFIDLLPFQPVQ